MKKKYLVAPLIAVATIGVGLFQLTTQGELFTKVLAAECTYSNSSYSTDNHGGAFHVTLNNGNKFRIERVPSGSTVGAHRNMITTSEEEISSVMFCRYDNSGWCPRGTAQQGHNTYEDKCMIDCVNFMTCTTPTPTPPPEERDCEETGTCECEELGNCEELPPTCEELENCEVPPPTCEELGTCREFGNGGNHHSSGGNGGDNGGGSNSNSECAAARPGSGVHNLTGFKTGDRSVTLYWANADELYTHYVIEYRGNTYGDTHAVKIDKVTQYQINELMADQNYTFKVFPLNDCQPGEAMEVTVGMGQKKAELAATGSALEIIAGFTGLTSLLGLVAVGTGIGHKHGKKANS